MGLLIETSEWQSIRSAATTPQKYLARTSQIATSKDVQANFSPRLYANWSGVSPVGKISFINSIPDAAPLYQQLNAQFFGDLLPACEIRWNRRLTRAAGNIRVQSRVISLSIPLLIDAFQGGATHEVCGVAACDGATALREILKHEMIHLWLHVQKLPCGHTAAFRAKARQIGQAKTRHGIALPTPKNGWIYSCAHCDSQITRRRRISRVGACARCCNLYNAGKFDARFLLSGRHITN